MVRAAPGVPAGALRAWGIKLLDPPFDIFLRFELFVKHIFYSPGATEGGLGTEQKRSP